jgi:Bifunctional DNA primase/polymerase, N-terminal
MRSAGSQPPAHKMTQSNRVMSMEKLKPACTIQAALAALKEFPWLHLFPVAFDNKAQPLLKDYLKRASNDPAQIRRWHAYWKTRFNGVECWWGVAPALSGLVFADIDTKSGKPGQQTFELFDMLYGWPQTRITGSPSGGRHHWYRGRHLFAIGTDKSSHPGIDFAQYVILPGCMKTDGTGYTLLEDHPIFDAPDWFYSETKRSAATLEAVEQEPVVDFDEPTNVDWAIKYLLHDAPQSIVGQGGEQTTLDVATVLKDYGISEPTALALMAKFYNVVGRCDPIWSMDETPAEDSLPVKVHNAYTYKRNTAPGASSAEAEFANDDFEIMPLDKKTAAIVARQRLERAKAKADEADGIRLRKPRRMDKKRRNALKRAAAMATQYWGKSNGR